MYKKKALKCTQRRLCPSLRHVTFAMCDVRVVLKSGRRDDAKQQINQERAGLETEIFV